MKYLLITLVALVSIQTFAQDDSSEMKALFESKVTEPIIRDTKEYAIKDSSILKLDLYYPDSKNDKQTTVIYVFGGGFIMGERDAANNVPFYVELVKRGYRVIAIDYRLGLKGVRKVSPLNPKPAFEAVKLATEDLVSATKYIIDNHQRLGVDTSRIVVIGSSAGAITVLQTDYEMANRTAMVEALPSDFRYRGVVSLAGAVFSTKGRPKYEHGPSPTMFFHGTKDKIVVYDKIQVFNLGMFGTNALVREFEREGFSYMAVRYERASHEVAEFPRKYNLDLICDFVDMASDGKFDNQVDMMIKDRHARENFRINFQSRKDLYN